MEADEQENAGSQYPNNYTKNTLNKYFQLPVAFIQACMKSCYNARLVKVVVVGFFANNHKLSHLQH